MLRPKISATQIDDWRREGGLLLEGFFDEKELADARAEMDLVYSLEPMAVSNAQKSDGDTAEEGAFHSSQLEAIRGMPAFAAPNLNMLALNLRLLRVVKALLDADEVQIYTHYMWRKESGGTDFNQPFHRDYPTHQLLVPSDDPMMGAVNLFIYLTDVTRENGALSYVPLSASVGYGIDQAQPGREAQRELSKQERFVECPAGSVFFYNTRTLHRGTSLAENAPRRDVVGAGFRRSDMAWMGPTRGDFHPLMPHWRELFEMAHPEQLNAYGVPMPGHAYWTEETIRGTEGRYPNWNSDPYRQAAGLANREDSDPSPPMVWPTIAEVSGFDVEGLREELRNRRAS